MKWVSHEVRISSSGLSWSQWRLSTIWAGCNILFRRRNKPRRNSWLGITSPSTRNRLYCRDQFPNCPPQIDCPKAKRPGYSLRSGTRQRRWREDIYGRLKRLEIIHIFRNEIRNFFSFLENPRREGWISQFISCENCKFHNVIAGHFAWSRGVLAGFLQPDVTNELGKKKNFWCDRFYSLCLDFNWIGIPSSHLCSDISTDFQSQILDH